MNNRPEEFKLDGFDVVTQEQFWNITDDVIQLTKRDLLKEDNKLSKLKDKIINYFQENYRYVHLKNHLLLGFGLKKW